MEHIRSKINNILKEDVTHMLHKTYFRLSNKSDNMGTSLWNILVLDIEEDFDFWRKGPYVMIEGIDYTIVNPNSEIVKQILEQGVNSKSFSFKSINATAEYDVIEKGRFHTIPEIRFNLGF